jgi:hypothetical protein
MQRFCSRALWAVLLLPAALNAEVSGTVAIGGGGALLDGDRPSFQQALQQKKDGFGGLESLRVVREDDETIFTFNARVLSGNDDYKLNLRLEKPEAYYLDAGLEQFRVWYDGSGGRYLPTGLAFQLFDEDLSLTRSRLWFEAGVYLPGETLLRLRYDRFVRDGTKNTTSWGDSNRTPVGARSIVPAFYDIMETKQVFAADLSNNSKEDVKWKVGARYSETELDNKRNMRRRPLETADRIVTSKDATKTDLFSAHGFYQRLVNQQLTISAGALVTELDSNLAGSRIYGQTYDPVYNPTFLRRQQRDEGFYNLTGSGDLKQTVLNLNAVYVPRKDWSIRPSIRYENLHQETMADFIETNIGAGPAFAAIIEHAETESKKKWDEFSEALEIRYTGKPNWTFNVEGLWVQGSGNLQEEFYVHGAKRIDRENDNERTTQKYSTKANWYAKPGLSFAAQYYYKTNSNDYDAIRDNTPPGTADRYPAFITDQDFKTHDFNVRASWKPMSNLSLVTRYDYQRSRIVSNEAGLNPAESSELTSHILSESVTWTPTARLYLSANVNLTWDQLATPAYRFVYNSDNNYVNGTLSAGYALAEKDDVFLDYSYFRADNFTDHSLVTLPYAADQKQNAVYLTWVRKQTDHLVYTVRYGYATKRDITWGGLNDFDAHLLYARVQYHF